MTSDELPLNPADRELTTEELAARVRFISALPTNDSRRTYMDLVERGVRILRKRYPIGIYSNACADTAVVAGMRDLADGRKTPVRLTSLIYLAFALGRVEGAGIGPDCECVFSAFRNLIGSAAARLTHVAGEQEGIATATRLIQAIERDGPARDGGVSR